MEALNEFRVFNEKTAKRLHKAAQGCGVFFASVPNVAAERQQRDPSVGCQRWALFRNRFAVDCRTFHFVPIQVENLQFLLNQTFLRFVGDCFTADFALCERPLPFVCVPLRSWLKYRSESWHTSSFLPEP